MANGDAAAAAGMDVVASTARVNLGYDEINKSRDYVAARGITPGTPLTIARGGTASSSAAGARTALGVPGWADVAPAGNVFSNLIARFGPTGKLQVTNPTDPFDVATKGYVDSAVSGGSWNGGVVTGQIYLPNATPATAGYVVCYLNNDGRISRGASARRYKKSIRKAPELGDLFAAPWSEFEMRGGDGTRVLGYVADDLAELPDLARFVVFGEDGRVESIDFIQLLLAQVWQLSQRVAQLEATAS